jgi:hypothetical protein
MGIRTIINLSTWESEQSSTYHLTLEQVVHSTYLGLLMQQVLRKLVDDASKFLNEKITKAVVFCLLCERLVVSVLAMGPANFPLLQRHSCI